MAAEKTGFSVNYTGLGGHGAVTFGQYLAEAAMEHYENIVVFPNYAPVMRGGDSETTVIASNEEVDSPLVNEVDAVITSSPLMFRAVEKRVCPQGVFVVDSSLIKEQVQRQDLQAIYIPAAKLASEKFGESLVTNFILMGAYLKATDALPIEAVEQLMEKKLKGTPKERLLTVNVSALREGAALV